MSDLLILPCRETGGQEFLEANLSHTIISIIQQAMVLSKNSFCKHVRICLPGIVSLPERAVRSDAVCANLRLEGQLPMSPIVGIRKYAFVVYQQPQIEPNARDIQEVGASNATNAYDTSLERVIGPLNNMQAASQFSV